MGCCGGKEAEVSRLQETLADLKGEETQASDEHAASSAKEHALHAECDFLLQNYEEMRRMDLVGA